MTTENGYAPSLLKEQRNAAVAVYLDLPHAEDAVRSLEHSGFDIAQLSIVAHAMNKERHVIGVGTPSVMRSSPKCGRPQRGPYADIRGNERYRDRGSHRNTGQAGGGRSDTGSAHGRARRVLRDVA